MTGTTIGKVLQAAVSAYTGGGRRQAPLERAVFVRNRMEVLRYSSLLISALQEAIEFSPLKHHNQPPPTLRIENDEYLEEIRKLVAELKRMNEFLEASKLNLQAAGEEAGKIGKHLDVFLGSYSKQLGKGAATLTIGVAVTLLYQAGVGKEIIESIWAHWKPS